MLRTLSSVRSSDRSSLSPDVIVIGGDVFHSVRPSNPAILHAFTISRGSRGNYRHDHRDGGWQSRFSARGRDGMYPASVRAVRHPCGRRRAAAPGHSMIADSPFGSARPADRSKCRWSPILRYRTTCCCYTARSKESSPFSPHGDRAANIYSWKKSHPALELRGLGPLSRVPDR